MQFTVTGLGRWRWRNAHYSDLITAAAHEHFKLTFPPDKEEGPAAYLVGGYLRVVYDEILVQFEPDVTRARCREILEATGFEVKPDGVTKSKWIVRYARTWAAGESLLAAADQFKRFEEVLFAWPNSVSEYVKANVPAALLPRDWWLETIGVVDENGDPDLNAGNPDVRIAVLDDGVEVQHPNLVNRVAANLGRNYTVAVTDPAHHDPRPQVQVSATAPADHGDYHGTSCAGIVCSDGSEVTQPRFRGVAPGCTLVPVRMVNGKFLAPDQWVADAIDYATDKAHVILCAWYGADHGAVIQSLNDTRQGRDGRGVAVFGAAGNFGGSVVEFPARHIHVIAVGACTHDDQRPSYANIGDDLDIVAPSLGSGRAVYTTDVSGLGWGFNPVPGANGQFWQGFGGTSAATAIAAGVGALCISADPNLTVDELRNILQGQAFKIGQQNGSVLYTMGHSQKFGYGRIDAAAAVAEATP